MHFNVPFAKKPKQKNSNPDIEDWDSEIEQNISYSNIIKVCSLREKMNSVIIDEFQNTVNRYPPSCQAYTSVAYYDSFSYKKCEEKIKVTPSNSFAVVDGQFDDS